MQGIPSGAMIQPLQELPTRRITAPQEHQHFGGSPSPLNTVLSHCLPCIPARGTEAGWEAAQGAGPDPKAPEQLGLVMSMGTPLWLWEAVPGSQGYLYFDPENGHP